MKIAKLALITALIGTVALLILSYHLEPRQTQISEINEARIGEFVSITGSVVNAKQGKVTTFNLKDETGEINVVSFDKINVSKGDSLYIIGKVGKYYSRLQVEAQKITRIS